MSIYENYHATSENYDATRVPVGLEIVLGYMSRLGRPVSELTVLDAGCGTGNYSHELLKHVGRIEAVDLNEGMLEQAAKKLANEVQAGRIAFHQSTIESLPFDAESFDAIVINQVIHHLEDVSGGDVRRHTLVFKEFQRILKPGGILVINTCSKEQLRKGYWYYDLIPHAVERLATKYMEMDGLKALLGRCGLEVTDRIVPLECVLQGAAYFEPARLLDPNCRAGDSTFALLSDAELDQFEGELRSMDEAGTLADYFDEKDRHRSSFGQSMFVCAVRE